MTRPYTSEAFDERRFGARMASQPRSHGIESRWSDPFATLGLRVAGLALAAAFILGAPVAAWAVLSAPSTSHVQER